MSAFQLSPVSTTRVDGLSTTQQTRVMETSHPSTQAVNSGSGNRALQVSAASVQVSFSFALQLPLCTYSISNQH